jgi:hypothetical protein
MGRIEGVETKEAHGERRRTSTTWNRRRTETKIERFGQFSPRSSSTFEVVGEVSFPRCDTQQAAI